MPDYKETLNLPKTAFEMRAGLAEKEPRILAQWERDGLYERLQKARAQGPLFVMHDGPPYANGHLHHGHILNKVLKDIVVRDHAMRGARAGFIPGWDCHGLPIEVQVDKELGKKKGDMSTAEVRAACRTYAEKFVAIQREEFKRLGVLARWDKPYLTMSTAYEAVTLRELAKFADAGLLIKGLRPVHWCAFHRTALAEAEVEYEDHTSPSIYVAMPLDKPPKGLGGAVDVVIWTTTPWTLPANLAVCLHPDFDYVAVELKGRVRIVAEKLLASFAQAIGAPVPARHLARYKGRDLEGLTYRHPLFDKTCPLIVGDHVTLEAGTGCVHTAPGHGPEDFEVGRRYGLGVVSPIDDGGVFTQEAGPFAGTAALASNPLIIEALVRQGLLLNKATDTVTHRYAHCWRCHRPILLRATEQWFAALDRPFANGGTLREKALAALDAVRWIPPWGHDRIHGMLAVRPDWCLSRQRLWGVPIPVAYCQKCGEPVVEAKRMNKVADVFAREGADAWFVRPLEELMGPLVCGKCGGTAFRKETDILDVWFEAGVSYAAVIEAEEAGHREGPPVDLYLEGSDQHRGWFHASLLCGLAGRGVTPYRSVLTHGFVVDGEGKKISKSKGNFIDPFETIKRQGAEILRLWAAAEDYREDIRISNEILTRLADSYRKIRNTVRYLLGNLYDFDPNLHMIAGVALRPLDAYALLMSEDARSRIDTAYQEYEFHLVLQRLVELGNVDLSAFYLDVLKDRLYASRPASEARRSAQTALYMLARDLLRMRAPIFCFTADEAWAHLP
ncbi:MAG: isoleucine--tRNA ligase, partial [Deltaproteobacteria bacterium]|nr:isoleucine--tRNA ligase [Deltaproteobacteria bacterium]